MWQVQNFRGEDGDASPNGLRGKPVSHSRKDLEDWQTRAPVRPYGRGCKQNAKFNRIQTDNHFRTCGPQSTAAASALYFRSCIIIIFQLFTSLGVHGTHIVCVLKSTMPRHVFRFQTSCLPVRTYFHSLSAINFCTIFLLATAGW